jgi:hypothetical protein
MNKFCVITQQRTGSTLCLRLIEKYFANKHMQSLNLGELWEVNNSKIIFKVENDQWRVASPLKHYPKIEMTANEMLEHNISTIQTIGDDVAVCFKVFAGGNLEAKDRLMDILAKLGYTFILLERDDVEQMFMSQLLSELTGNWANSEYKKMNVDMAAAKVVFDRRVFSMREYNEFLERHSDKLSSRVTVKYENIFNDIGAILGIFIPENTDSKQSKKDHYEYVENSVEVRELLSQYSHITFKR